MTPAPHASPHARTTRLSSSPTSCSGESLVAFGERMPHLLGWARAAEIEALPDLAAKRAEQFPLSLSLDALRHHAQPKRAREAEHGGDNPTVGLALAQASRERTS